MFLKILKYDLAKTDFGYTKDFVIYDENESSAVVKQCIKELKMEDDIELREVKSVISKFKNQWILASSVMKKADTGYEKTAGMIYEKYEKKLKTNDFYFDWLLQRFDWKQEKRKQKNKFSFWLIFGIMFEVDFATSKIKNLWI